MKHTQTFWEVSTDRGQHAVISGERVMAYTGQVGAKDNEESVANARLIAAAPELLEALIACHRALAIFSAGGIAGTSAEIDAAKVLKKVGAL
jgi:hypothetical protein